MFWCVVSMFLFGVTAGVDAITKELEVVLFIAGISRKDILYDIL